MMKMMNRTVIGFILAIAISAGCAFPYFSDRLGFGSNG
jgi:hypothetical protein